MKENKKQDSKVKTNTQEKMQNKKFISLYLNYWVLTK